MMGGSLLLFLLPIGILCQQYFEYEEKREAPSLQIDKFILTNIEKGKLIGCKYQNLCRNDRACFDDLLFGTCLKPNEAGDFVYVLAPEFEKILELAMRDLFKENFKWNDFYTQCFLQSVLKSSELQQYLDVQHCKTTSNSNLLRHRTMDMDQQQLFSDFQVSALPAGIAKDTLNERKANNGAFVDRFKSLLEEFNLTAPTEPKTRNEEFINPRSNSEEAMSTTRVNYEDSGKVRKVLKIARRAKKNWIWLKLNKNITKADEINIINTISKTLQLPEKIDNYLMSTDRKTIFFKLPQQVLTDAANVTKYFSTHKNSIPGLEIEDSGYGHKSAVMVSEAKDDPGFMITLIICCIVLLAVVLMFVGFCIQKMRHKKDKLGEVINSKYADDNTANYKDLFRVSNNKESAGPKNKQGVGRMNNKQHSGDTPAASSPVSTRSSTSSWTDDVPVTSNMDIYTGHMILSYMEKHLKNKEMFQSEWNSITSYETEDDLASEAKNELNAEKNRYQNKIPYDKSRVILKQNVNGNYINASFIYDHDPKVPAYIATQLPLKNTVADFWQMVWEQGVVIIVSLSELEEMESPRFWPKEGTEIFNIYEVNLVSEHVWSDEYLVRNFYLKNLQSSETRTVTQFHFLKWSDHHIPTSSRSVLEFRRKVNKSYRSKSTPIIVSCNDGCGRAGTYILLDLILNRIGKGLKEMDIAATLEHLRDQRMDLVETEEQFGYVLTTISEEVNNILKVLNN